MRIDRHLEAAFDLSDSEFEALLQSLPEGERDHALRARRLKAGLRALRETPECQLTTEHLRRAVLESGMKRPAPRPWTWGWALAPVAMVGAWLSLSHSEPRFEKALAPTVTDGSVPSESVAMVESDAAPTASTAPVAAVRPSAAPQAKPMTERAAISGSVAKRAVRTPTPGLQPPNRSLVLAKWTSHEDADWVAPVSFDKSASSEPVAGSSTEPVVVIVTESPDPTTGGHQAVEVSRQADVVFGG